MIDQKKTHYFFAQFIVRAMDFWGIKWFTNTLPKIFNKQNL